MIFLLPGIKVKSVCLVAPIPDILIILVFKCGYFDFQFRMYVHTLKKVALRKLAIIAKLT